MFVASFFLSPFEPHAGKIADVLRSTCPSGTPKYLQIRAAKSRLAEPLKISILAQTRTGGPGIAR
jgi:hypothetical protein